MARQSTRRSRSIVRAELAMTAGAGTAGRLGLCADRIDIAAIDDADQLARFSDQLRHLPIKGRAIGPDIGQGVGG